MKFLATVAAATAMGMVSTEAALPATVHPKDDLSRKMIVGGSIAPQGRYPWQAGLSNSRNAGTFFCGGSMITPNTILSAAHCGGPSVVEVGCFRSNDNCEQRDVALTVLNPNYNPNTNANDISLIFVNNGFRTVPSIPFIADASYANLASGTDVTVTGWGTTSSGGSLSLELREVEVDVVSSNQCNNAYGGGIQSNMLCAARNGRDSCQGDSGGPLFIKCNNNRDVQVGVVSFGIGCANPNFPGVYSRVSSARPWIDSTLAQLGLRLPTPPSLNNVCNSRSLQEEEEEVEEVVIEGWTCDPAYYNATDGCDCSCGIPDPDCEAGVIQNEFIHGCEDGEHCLEGVCINA